MFKRSLLSIKRRSPMVACVLENTCRAVQWLMFQSMETKVRQPGNICHASSERSARLDSSTKYLLTRRKNKVPYTLHDYYPVPAI